MEQQQWQGQGQGSYVEEEGQMIQAGKKGLSGSHRGLHRKRRIAIEDIIAGCRDRLGVETIWSVAVLVCCPSQLPTYEAAVYFDPEAHYARLYMRCDVPEDLVGWLVYHELCELQQWRTGLLIREMLQHYREVCAPFQEHDPLEQQVSLEQDEYWQRWLYLRNQEIEWRVHGLLRERRPGHLTMRPAEPVGFSVPERMKP